MSKLAFDIDGVLADFTSSYGHALIEVTGRNLLPDGWETNPEFPLTWYWERDAGYTKEEEQKTWNEKILSSATFWKKLAPLPDTKDVIKQINRLAREGHDIYFLTHRMGKQAKKQTEEWLYNLGVNYPTVLLSGNKTPLLQALEIDFFVDDKLSTVEDAALHYMKRGKGCVVLKDAPYNREGRSGNFAVASNALEALDLGTGLVK